MAAETRERRTTRKAREPLLKETVMGILSILFFLLGILLILGIVHAGGKGGDVVFKGMFGLFGVFAFLSPFLFLAIAYYLWKEELPEMRFLTLVGSLAILVGGAGLAGLTFGKAYGGVLGSMVSDPLLSYFSVSFSALLLISFAIIGWIIIWNRKPSLETIATPARMAHHYMKSVIHRARHGKTVEVPIVSEEEIETQEKELIEELTLEEEPAKNVRQELLHELQPEDTPEEEPLPQKKQAPPLLLTPEFVPPPLELLNADSGKSGAGDSRTKMATIQRTLAHFRINVEMGEVTVGPTVTQFTLKPAQGVNLSKIVSLHDNLAMELGAEFLRIEAPIPGKTLVGVEVPNERKALLGLRSMLEMQEFTESGPLTLAIGKSIVGKPVFGDLSKMPHLLVAGATRTGKSVTLQNLLISLLYKNSPYDLKLIILDPKRVEFTAYNNLPHLYTPIIKEPKSAIKALNWAIGEMERRYEVLAEHGQVNVDDYNKKVLAPALEKARKKSKEGQEVKDLPPKLPYIIILFDEYNDFMLSYPKEITPLITSLTQKGRAAGIHLILATQRPDVKVITGTIKANIPARIALKTTSQIDSRTILDTSGAEDLLGNGDMLYMASDNPRLLRLQAPFVSTEEIRSVVSYVKESNLDFIPDHIDISKVKARSVSSEDSFERNSGEEPDDEDYQSAKDYVISTGKASTSALQTAFRWGYNKAARIMGDLETFSVIGPARPGERYREILQGKSPEEDLGKQQEPSPSTDDNLDDLFANR